MFGDNYSDNLNFIAHSRQDVPDLIAEIRRLREALEWYADAENTPFFIHKIDNGVQSMETAVGVGHYWTKARQALGIEK